MVEPVGEGARAAAGAPVVGQERPDPAAAGVVAKTLLQLLDEFQDGQTRSRNRSEEANIRATASAVATVTSQRNPTVDIETGAGKRALTTVPSGAVTRMQRRSPSFQSISPWQRKLNRGTAAPPTVAG